MINDLLNLFVPLIQSRNFRNGHTVFSFLLTSCNPIYRREAFHIWKERLGSEATYRKLIDIFEHAGYRNYADLVKSLICDAESEGDDSSDYEEPIPQPDTYPHLKPSPLSSPKSKNRRMSSCDEFLLINQTNTQDLPKGQNCIRF